MMRQSIILVGLVAGVLFVNGHIRPITDVEMKTSAEAGYSYVDRLTQLEEDLHTRGHYVKKDSPFYRMAQFKKSSPKAMALGQKARRMLEASKYLKSQLGLADRDSGLELMKASALDPLFSAMNDTCLDAPTCGPSKYRTIDGSCNSQTVANLGRSNTNYRRLAQPDYADGIEQPRRASDGSELPNARFISTEVFANTDNDSSVATLALMQFGQFINHDFQFTGQFTYANGTDIACCTNDFQPLDPSQLHPACWPIDVDVDDPIYNQNQLTTTCMSFVRSIAGPRLDCSLGYADQLNQNTHWLDGSGIYGSTDAAAANLRTFSGGLLSMTRDTVNKRDLLPVSPDCTNGACFYAGDARAIEQPQLAVMHTLWAREHNRVARELKALNPSWNDESLYQEARRIVVAELQHITYNEFLPNLLSPVTMSKYSLYPLTSGFFTGYTDDVTAGPVSNEFATAAFRMGHSLVQGQVTLYDENYDPLKKPYTMSNTFNDASMLVNDPTFIDSVIRGLLNQPVQSVDRMVVDELWLFLFRELSRKFGFDIVALNIQRGRDHGLPSYDAYRKFCGFPKVNSFPDLNLNLGPDMPRIANREVAVLSSTYASVHDIDVYVAGLTEITMQSGGLVGATLACLIGDHFQTLKTSDRFYYELGNQPHSFTEAQLDEIRKTSLSRIFCDNNDGTVATIQPHAFQPVSDTNVRIRCENTNQLPRINLSLWQGEPLF